MDRERNQEDDEGVRWGHQGISARFMFVVPQELPRYPTYVGIHESHRINTRTPQHSHQRFLEPAVGSSWTVCNHHDKNTDQQRIPPGWFALKFHYLQHYPEQIRSKGVLSFRLTNRTETWHKTIKDAYRRSNKGPQSLEFCVRDEARRYAWAVWEADLLQALKEEDGNEIMLDDVNTNTGERRQTWTLTVGKEWKGIRGVAWVADQLGEGYQALATETSRCLRWIHGGRNTTVTRSRRDGDWQSTWG